MPTATRQLNQNQSVLTWNEIGQPDRRPDGTKRDWGTANVLVWASQCGRYQAYRIESKGRDKVEFGACYLNKQGAWWSCESERAREMGHYPKYYSSLELAMEAAERYHASVNRLEQVTSNAAVVCEGVGESALGGVGSSSSEPAILSFQPKSTSRPTKKAPHEAKEPRHPRKRATGAMGCADAAYKALKEFGKPTRIEDLTKDMLDKGYWSTNGATPAATVASRLYVEINTTGAKSRFRKTGKGMFEAV